MYLLLFHLFTVTSFHLHHHNAYRILHRHVKNRLLDIDNELNAEKQKIRQLLVQKNNLLKNKTGLILHNDSYIENYLENIEQDPYDEDEINNEYDYEFKPRPHKINIIINQGPPPQKEDVRSENFEIIHDSNHTFQQIGGYELIKEELMQCADMLVNYTKYAKYNVRTPKGIILEGPPGNGKTLMAKCFSGEIQLGFIPVSGAQFQEKYVGVGSSRVRELFKLAQENVPCIIFIDELDALGRKRTSDTASNTEHDSTLNELLVQLDGFKSASGIFIMGATNRIDLLDTALLRPGRIDKKIYIGNPDKDTRIQIIRIHRENKPLDATITTEYLTELTNGFSGAEIENFLNEATLYVLRQNREIITKDDLNMIANRILVGFQSTKNQLSEEMIYQVAVHEIGHALMGIFTKHRKLIKITINLYSPKSLGFTLFEPSSTPIQTKEQLISEMMILLGGRIAEEILFKDVSSGASQDLQQVKKIAEQMIVHLGMGDKVVISDPAQINAEIDHIIEIAYARTKILLSNAEPLIKDCAKMLTINYELTPEMITTLMANKYPHIR